MNEIDVTKCKFHSTNNGFTGAYCTAHNNYCRHIRNCYFKQLHRYKQVVKDIKKISESNIDDTQIMAVQTLLNGSPDNKNKVLAKIIQKCKEVNK